MKTINDLTIFEIVARIDFLTESRKEIIGYFNDTSFDDFDHLDRVEGDKARKLRSIINTKISKINEYVISAMVNTYIYYSPPPAIGGLAGNIDLFANIFNLARFEIDPQQITDAIERAIGKYENQRKAAIIRTFNPFWWIFKLIRAIAYVPFLILKEIGFDTSKFERTILGRLIKLIFDLAVFLAALLAILKALGVDEQVINWVKGIF